MKKTGVFVCAAFLSPSLVFANGDFVNGSFESGDYTGWTLWEGGASTDPFWGTWGIAFDDQTVYPGDAVFDYFDGIYVPVFSPGYPKTFHATDGVYLAIQAQLGEQTHRMYQDIALDARAKKMKFDMEYTTWAPFFPDNQVLTISLRDVNDNILEVLFQTVEGNSPYSIPMTTFEFDVKDYRNQTVRVDVELIANEFFFDAAFDNFSIERSEIPPGWYQGLKNGWVGDLPPGLEELPPGFDDGTKAGWGTNGN